MTSREHLHGILHPYKKCGSMQGIDSHDVADCLTGVTPEAPSASGLQHTTPARVRAMAAALSQQRTMEGLSDKEGTAQGRDTEPAGATACDERPGRKRKRAPATELMVSHDNWQSSMEAAGLPAAPATLRQPKSARLEQMMPSASAEAHAEASTHAEAGTHAAAALADTPADVAGAGMALAMQAALAGKQQYPTDPSEGQQSPQAGADAARAWQAQTHQPDAVPQEGCAVPDSACIALQVYCALP